MAQSISSWICLEQMSLSDKTSNAHVQSLCAGFPNPAILILN